MFVFCYTAHMKINKKAVLITITIPVLLAMVVIGFFLVSYVWAKMHQISQAQASQICQDFYNDVRSQLASAPAYTIDKSAKQCLSEPDESGFTDYILVTQFKVALPDKANAQDIKGSLEDLASHIPKKNYPVTIQNMQDSQYACVSASRYIDDNGKDVPQGDATGPQVSYIDPAAAERTTVCDQL